MKACLSLFFFLLHSFFLSAQDTLQQKELDEVLIYSGKFAEKKKNIVQRIEIVESGRITQLNAQNTGDLLMQTGNVFVQKSQQGGSSPVIRGMEASRVLLVIDGIRMNNAIYRSGHLQNVITVDQNILDRIEVLYGPSSTIYGSDALGGVLHMRTRLPRFSSNDKRYHSGSAFTRYSSANHEKTVHADLNLGWKNFAWLQSWNFSDFDDLRMGSRDHKNYPGFGRRNEYIGFINGIDSVIKNSDNRIQKFSGYHQYDILQKLLFKAGSNWTHMLNLQFSNSGNIPRYDRLQDRRNSELRFAEWYYGPQTRLLAGYEINGRNTGFFDELRAISSYQRINESRHQRLYRNASRQNRLEKLDVAAFTLDGRKFLGQHELTLGLDAQLNFLQSAAYAEDIYSGYIHPLDSRYPDGKNSMHLAGIYAQHLFKFGQGKWVLNDGIRVQHASLRSSIEDNSFFNFPFTSIEQDHWAITGNAGLVYMPAAAWRFNAGFSSGFRSPNIDDLAKIFESNSASAQLIVPNPSIKPEYTWNTELGISWQQGKTNLEAGVYYTRFTNAITLAPFRINGEDSVLYNGLLSAVFANQNLDKAFIWGYHAGFNTNPFASLKISGTVNYTFGRLQPATSGRIPLDHIPPVYGRLSIDYSKNSFTAGLFSIFNGWKKLEDYHPSGEDNAQYATADGTPAWFTLNLRTSFTFSNWILQAGMDNILDSNYRVFASGFSAPGRNLILALRFRF